MVNISWSSDLELSLSINKTYSVTVVSSNTHTQIDNLQETFYIFTAPNDTLTCEVYNFSVTATPVGATYTGDGCSVLSPVLSRMLPSLPEIKGLEFSLNYLVMKVANAIIVLAATFIVSYCMYS